MHESVMLVYRDQTHTCETDAWLAALRRRRSSRSSSEALRDFLVDFGEFETAVVDANCPVQDDVNPLICHLRHVGLTLAKGFVLSLRGARAAALRAEDEARCLIDGLECHALPRTVVAKAAEGYAFWGLYPDQYVNASKKVLDHLDTDHVAILGLRTAGASLASVVEACLTLAGVDVYSRTVRPHGHPFHRELRLGRALSGELVETRKRLHLVVDEGPGMSGSSFASAASALHTLGVARDRVWFVPSHGADGSRFVNADAMLAWRVHERITGDFSPLSLLVPYKNRYVDVSAGKWRSALGRSQLDDLPVYPAHERLKYLTLDRKGRPARIYKFCGLGHHGRTVLERARRMYRSGFGQRVHDLRHGMLELEFVAGTSLVHQPPTSQIVSYLANYVAFRRQEFRAPADADPCALFEMAKTNVSECLGAEALSRLERLFTRAGSLPSLAVIADARMFPHEWLCRDGRFVKLDGVDHGDDHFYPGPCDPAWDLAGTIVEFGLNRRLTAILMSRYRLRSGDLGAASRLPFFVVAYLAFRVGYCSLARQALGESLEATGFGRLLHNYRRRLHSLLQT